VPAVDGRNLLMELGTCFEMGAIGHRMIAPQLRHTVETIFCNALHTRSSRCRLFGVAERTATRLVGVEQGGWMHGVLVAFFSVAIGNSVSRAIAAG
jgi:hypothetical protein